MFEGIFQKCGFGITKLEKFPKILMLEAADFNLIYNKFLVMSRRLTPMVIKAIYNQAETNQTNLLIFEKK